MKKIILAAIVLVLNGCNGDSSSGNNNVVANKVAVRQLLHDYGRLSNGVTAYLYQEPPSDPAEFEIYKRLAGCESSQTSFSESVYGDNCPLQYESEYPENGNTLSRMKTEDPILLQFSGISNYRLDGTSLYLEDGINSYSESSTAGYIEHVKLGTASLESKTLWNQVGDTFTSSLWARIGLNGFLSVGVQLSGTIYGDSTDLDIQCKLNEAIADCQEVFDLLGISLEGARMSSEEITKLRTFRFLR